MHGSVPFFAVSAATATATAQTTHVVGPGGFAENTHDFEECT
jgi:hypothetical protein